ncbi:hypothetical protein Acr_18g0011550 [Actinidia rufa]|uniref:Uncharacterized protein n=1 Tax=Actinidia rufa TaxID=165716 RepID=A0A7J0G853_9ERIC|nr:hypothetical protein Acr_18g0011550 [Actinidia rufa]
MVVGSDLDVIEMFRLYYNTCPVDLYVEVSDVEGPEILGFQPPPPTDFPHEHIDVDDDSSDHEWDENTINISDNEGEEFHVDAGGRVRLAAVMLFGDVTKFREALRDFTIQEGKTIPASVKPAILRQTQHDCEKKLISSLRANHNMSLDAMQVELHQKFGIEASRIQLYRVKKKAIEVIEVNHSNSYPLLTTYATDVRKSNPSLVKMQCHRLTPIHNPVFKRFFISFEATKTGFMADCRPFIGIDGCHLKGPFGGVLSAVIGRAGNNGFGQSDAEMVPEASHRTSCQHLFNNFKKFPVLLLKKYFWQAELQTIPIPAQGLSQAEGSIPSTPILMEEDLLQLLEVEEEEWAQLGEEPLIEAGAGVDQALSLRGRWNLDKGPALFSLNRFSFSPGA